MILKNAINFISGQLPGGQTAIVVYYDWQCSVELPVNAVAIVFVLDGHAQLNGDDGHSELDAHQFFIVDGKMKCNLTIDHGTRLLLVIDRSTVLFNNDSMDIVSGRKLMITPQFRPFLFKVEKAVQGNIDGAEWLEKELRSLPPAFDMLLKVAREEMDRIPATKLSTRKALYRQLYQARDLMDAHFAENPGIADIAREANLSEFHFSRLFKKVFGKSPYQYMTEQRAINAFEMLTTNTPIGAINLSIGLDSQHSFSAFCKANTGLSPTELRYAYRYFMAKLAGLNKPGDG